MFKESEHKNAIKNFEKFVENWTKKESWLNELKRNEMKQ